jgi:hypothetical protein
MHSETPTYRNSPFSILLTWLYEIGSKQCVYLRNVILCINDEYPEDTHRADAIHRAWVHIAFPAPLIEKMVGNSPIYEDIGKRLQKAHIKVRMEKSHRRYCKALPDVQSGDARATSDPMTATRSLSTKTSMFSPGTKPTTLGMIHFARRTRSLATTGR